MGKARAHAARAHSLLLATLLACAVSSPCIAAAESERFELRGKLEPVAVSADQRFRVQAKAQRSPTKSSADGRFTLHEVHLPEGGCELADALFANGFE